MLLEPKLVSVVIPAYQHENYIRECIESVVAQSYPEIELIVIDDASPDGTLAVAESMRERCERRFRRTVIMTKEKGGAAASCNLGIELAEGEYIYLIASDDVASPQAVERLVCFLESHEEYVLAVGDNAIIDEQSLPIGWDGQRRGVPLDRAIYKTVARFADIQPGKRHFVDFGSYRTLLENNYIPNGYLMRRSALKVSGGYNTSIWAEDWYMNLQLAKIGKMKFIDEVLFNYRWHNKNTIKNYWSLKKSREMRRQIYDHEAVYAMQHGCYDIIMKKHPNTLHNKYLYVKSLIVDYIRPMIYINISKKEIRIFGKNIKF